MDHPGTSKASPALILALFVVGLVVLALAAAFTAPIWLGRDAERVDRAARLVDESPLMKAVESRDAAKVRRELSRGADPNAMGSHGSALMMASGKGDPAAVRELLRHGARVNERNAAGENALMVAVLVGETSCAAILLDAGADPVVVRTDGESCLSLARTPEMRNLLLKHGGSRTGQ